MTTELHRLPNGFRVVTEHMPGLESAAIGIWVGAGGRHERADQNGIAHFLEHMAFKGTKRRSALQIAEEIEDVGGYINAYTSREVTAYYARVLREDVPLALDVIADILQAPVFDAREIEVERGVILQEIGQARDTPDDVIFDWLQEAAYPDQPMGRTILGPPEQVSRFSKGDLGRFMTEHYGPENMILSAAGAVDHAQIVALAERYFTDLAPGALPAPPPARCVAGEIAVEKPLEQAHLAIGFEGPSYRDEAFYAAQVFATLLGGGMSSRLFQEARENRGLCYSIFAQHAGYSDTGLMTLYAGSSGRDIGALAELCMDEMKRAATDLQGAEIDRAIAQLKSGLLMGQESPSNRAERLARVVGVWDRLQPLRETVARIEAVDASAVCAIAEHYAGQAAMSQALYGPIASAAPLDRLARRLAA